MYYYKMLKSSKITAVESKSLKNTSPGFEAATREEFNSFISLLPIIPKPVKSVVMDYEKEIVKIKKRLTNAGI
tara:strand:- start:443 stop:661 length:219 start_codon:yes stop_codon:yes gene_type:complete